MNLCKREDSSKIDVDEKDSGTHRGELDTKLLDYLWHIKLDHIFLIKSKPHRIPRLKQAIGFLIPGYRCNKFLQECKSKKIQSPIEFFSP